MSKPVFHIIVLFSLLVPCTSCTNTIKEEAPAVDLMTSERHSKEALEKSWGLLQQAQNLADNYQSKTKIISILPDSAIIQTNEKAILFLITGSLPMLIELPQERSPKGKAKGGGDYASNVGKIQSPLLLTNNMINLLPADDSMVDVVASQRGEEERQEKKALIISTLWADFGRYDDARVAKGFLETNKNYKGNIDYVTDNISFDLFQVFDEYDLVHLSTHGQRFCNAELFADGSAIEIISGGESNFCRTLVESGIKHDIQNKDQLNDFFSENEEYKDLIVISTKGIWLRSAFFDHFYREALDNKIWVFSACELGQRSDISETINNMLRNGHFFYWSNSVFGDDAFEASRKLYENIAIKGLNAKKAYDEIPYALRENLPSEFVINYDSILSDNAVFHVTDTIGVTTSLMHLQTGEPRHGIELIEMWHPEEDVAIGANDYYPIAGDFGDGQPETLVLKVKLSGYTRSAFEEKQMSISLKVNDESVLNKKLFLPDLDNDEITIENIENNEFGIKVTIADIAIPDAGDKEDLTLKAYLHFNDEKFSTHHERVAIKAVGIQATLRDDSKSAVFTYDGKRGSLKIESDEAPGDAYMDKHGYMYANSSEHGWIKTDMSWVARRAAESNRSADAALEGIFSEITSNNRFIYPFTEWALHLKMSYFESKPNFEKQLENCGKPIPCQKYNNTNGTEALTYAIFNPGGKLIELGFKENNTVIKYVYGTFDVPLPDAQAFPFSPQ